MSLNIKTFLAMIIACLCLLATAADYEQDIYTVQLFKNGEAVHQLIPILAIGERASSVNRFSLDSQVEVKCLVGGPPSVLNFDRLNGVEAMVHRKSNTIYLDITILEVAPQKKPEKSPSENCVSMTANDQLTFKSSLEFNDGGKLPAEFRRELGNGYSLLFTASRMAR